MPETAAAFVPCLSQTVIISSLFCFLEVGATPQQSIKGKLSTTLFSKVFYSKAIKESVGIFVKPQRGGSRAAGEKVAGRLKSPGSSRRGTLG